MQKTSIRPTEHTPGDSAEILRLDGLLARAGELRMQDAAASRALAADALIAARKVEDRKRIAGALALLAFADLSLSSFHPAREEAAEALEIFRHLEDKTGQATTLNILAAIFRRLGDPESALEHELEGLALSRELGNERLEATALQGLGNLHRFLGENERALAYHEESRTMAVRLGDRYAEANALLGTGNTYEKLGRYREALEIYRSCQVIAAEIGDARLQAYSSGNIGISLERLGKNSEALVYELESLRWKEKIGDSWGIGVSYNNLGLIYRNLGDFASALEALLGSLEIAEKIGDEQGVAVAMNNIGETYEMLGDRTHVLDYHLRSLKISQTMGDRQGEAYSLTHIGRFYHNLGETANALLQYFRALRLFEACGDKLGQRELLLRMSQVYRAIGDGRRAEANVSRSLELAREMSDRSGEVAVLLELGDIHGALGDHDRQTAALRRAVDVARAIESKDLLRQAAAALADAYGRLGDGRRSSEYRRIFRQCTLEIFSEESTLRVREMLVGFEGNRIRKEGKQLGLRDEDIEEITAAIRQRERFLQPPETNTAATNGARQAAETIAAQQTLPGIRVQTFGAFRVVVAGQELAASDWKRKRARDLFKLLLIHHGRSLTIDEILEKLWGGASDKRSEMLVMNAISHIRRALEPERLPHRSSSILSGASRAYLLDLGDEAEIDFLRFKELIVGARRSTTARERRRLYEQAVELYNGDFLQEDLYEEWPAAERGLLKDAFLEALEYLAGDALRDGRSDETIGLARRILTCDSTSERAFELLLLALRDRGRSGEARRVHAECIRVFREELGVEPPERLGKIVSAPPLSPPTEVPGNELLNIR